MKNVIKEKRILFTKIISVLLACCLLVSVAYTCIVYINEKNSLIKSANIDYYDAFDTFEMLMKNHTSFYYLVNARTYSDSKLNKGLLTDDFENTQIIIKNDRNEIVGETGNYYASNFKIYSEVFMDIYIDYNKLCNSISQKQYNEIIKILTSSDRYKLVCTKFAYENSEIIPSKLTIVENEYDSNSVYKSYTLTSNERYSRTNNNFNENIIPVEFLLGNYNTTNIINNLKEDEYQQFSSTKNIVKISPFSFVFREKGYLEFFKNEYSFEYIRQYDILEHCQTKIIIGNSVIFVFFLLAGFLLFIMIWKIFNNQIMQEEKRKNLTNTIAHNLKTPLFIISGYAENLIENVNNEKRNHYAQVIKNQTEVMNDLIHQMLNFSKIDIHTQANKEVFSITKITQGIVLKFQEMSNKHIIFEFNEDIDICADKNLIETVIENLIDNAVKYSSGDIRIKISKNSFSISNSCLISNKKQLHKIWQPYYRLDNTNPNGNGLGLSIIKHILDLHNFKYGLKHKDNTLSIYFYF